MALFISKNKQNEEWMEVTAALGNGFAFMRKNRMEDIIMKDAIEKWLSEDKISE